jgi:hypothetical protein
MFHRNDDGQLLIGATEDHLARKGLIGSRSLGSPSLPRQLRSSLRDVSTTTVTRAGIHVGVMVPVDIAEVGTKVFFRLFIQYVANMERPSCPVWCL